jgi:hypothetical protein
VLPAALQAPPTQPPDESMLGLLVDARLDVWIGELLAPPLRRVGNLRDETPMALYQKLVALDWPPRPPGDAELAERYGARAGRKVHMGGSSVRRKWLAAWRAEHGVPWLAQL